MTNNAKVSKRSHGKTATEELLSGATERVLKAITELYESGLNPGTPGSLGLKVQPKPREP